MHIFSYQSELYTGFYASLVKCTIGQLKVMTMFDVYKVTQRSKTSEPGSHPQEFEHTCTIPQCDIAFQDDYKTKFMKSVQTVHFVIFI